MNLINPKQIDNKNLEFDIVIKSTDTNFTLSSYQCSFSFKQSIEQNDSISLNYVDTSSQLANIPINLIGYLTNDGINELVFTSGIGSDLITTDEKLVGKFNITSTMDINWETLDLKWNFSGNVNTILTDMNFSDITEPNNHQNFDNSVTDLQYDENLPVSFELSQNYPNPFNPITKINFTLPERSSVTLTVFNLLGQKITSLANDFYNAGVHTIEFDGNNLASGVYVYKLDIKDKYSAIKKMILLK